MANPFEILVMNLNQLGFFGFLLPWIFIFAVSFGLLAKTKVLGEDLKIIAVVSLVLAFFVVGFGGPWLANFFITLFGVGAVIIAAVLVIVLFLGMSGIGIEALAKSKVVLITLIAIGIIVFVVAVGATSIIIDPTVMAIVLMLIIMIMAFVMITDLGK